MLATADTAKGLNASACQRHSSRLILLVVRRPQTTSSRLQTSQVTARNGVLILFYRLHSTLAPGLAENHSSLHLVRPTDYAAPCTHARLILSFVPSSLDDQPNTAPTSGSSIRLPHIDATTDARSTQHSFIPVTYHPFSPARRRLDCLRGPSHYLPPRPDSPLRPAPFRCLKRSTRRSINPGKHLEDLINWHCIA